MPPSTGRKRWTHFCRNAIACRLSAFATWIILKSAAIQSLSPDASINISGGCYRKRLSAECAWCLQTSHENNMAVIDIICRSLASKSPRTRKHLRPIANGSVYPRRRLAGQANVLRHFARNASIVRLINKFPNPPNKDVGEGLNTAFQAMRERQLKPPVVTQVGGSVKVMLRHEPLATPEELVLEFLQCHEQITNKEGREICFIGSEN